MSNIKVSNKSKKTTLSENAKYATSFMDRLFGLHINKGCLIFKTRFGIHTLGLFRSIDVLVLDRNLKVACLKQRMLPNRFFFWHPKHFYVVELPQDSIKASNTSKGDQIEINSLNW